MLRSLFFLPVIFFSSCVIAETPSSSRATLDPGSALNAISFQPQVFLHSFSPNIGENSGDTDFTSEANGSLGAGLEALLPFSDLGSVLAVLRVDQVRYAVKHQLGDVNLATYEEEFSMVTLGLGASAKPLSGSPEFEVNFAFNTHLPFSYSSEIAECNGICETDSELEDTFASASFGLRYTFRNQMVANLLFTAGTTDLYRDAESEMRLAGFSFGLGYQF